MRIHFSAFSADVDSVSTHHRSKRASISENVAPYQFEKTPAQATRDFGGFDRMVRLESALPSRRPVVASILCQ